MKVLLIAVNSKYIHSTPAIYLIKAFAENQFADIGSGCSDPDLPENKFAGIGNGCSNPDLPEIDTAEYSINQQPFDVLSDIYSRRSDLIIFSCYIWNIEFIKKLALSLRLLLPETPFWAGGPEVSYDCDVFLRENPAFTGLIKGEGEISDTELIEHYCMRSPSLSEIKGLVYRTKDGNIEETPRRPLMDMDRLPFIYNEENIAFWKNKIIYYESSRGCPFSCSYCLSSVDKSVRFRSFDLVAGELKFFLAHNVRQVKFIDRTFNIKAEHCIKIFRFIKEHDNGLTNFHFEISGDILSEEMISIIEGMRPGLIQLEIGVQTTNPETIKAIRRKTDLKALKDHVSRIHSFNNTHCHLDLIAGLPYEDLESFRKSFNDVYALRPEDLQLGFLKVLKGAPIRSDIKEHDIKYSPLPPYEVLSTKYLDFDSVVCLKKIEQMTELYYNSAQFSQTLKYLEREFVSAFDMFKELSDFYDAHGCFSNSPSRLHRYDILLAFAESKGLNSAFYAQLLTFDLYLREHLKSRPGFAMDIKAFYQEIKTIERLSLLTPAADIHIEPFTYDLTSPDAADKPLKEPVFILFDYKKRSALTHNCSFRVISQETKG